MLPRSLIHDADDARRLFAPLADASGEVVGIAYLDPEWRLLGLRHVTGERGRTRPAIRTIVRDALAWEATAVVVAHNHPSGDPAPSTEDLAFTRDCARTLHATGVTLTDHLILTPAAWTSFRARGLL